MFLVMIRNLIVLDGSGMPVFTANYGECHSFGEDQTMISGLVSALVSFIQSATGHVIESVIIGELEIYFYQRERLTFVMLVDDKDKNDNKIKIQRIAKLFYDQYGEIVRGGFYQSEMFQEFGNLLTSLNIAQKNCGGRPDCDGCPNSKKTLPVSRLAQFFRRSRA